MSVRVVCRDRKAGRISYLAVNWQSTRRYYLTTPGGERDALVFRNEEEAAHAFVSFQRDYGKLFYQACYHEPVYVEYVEAVK